MSSGYRYTAGYERFCRRLLRPRSFGSIELYKFDENIIIEKPTPSLALTRGEETSTRLVSNELVLTITDEDGVTISYPIPQGEPANSPEKMKETFIKQFSKTGDSDFYISKYEVTQKLYKEVVEADPDVNSTPAYFSKDPVEGEVQELRPVERISWYDCLYFCNKLSEKEGLDPVYTIENISLIYTSILSYAQDKNLLLKFLADFGNSL